MSAVPTIDISKREAAEEVARTCEETGFLIDGKFVALNPLRQPSGKIVHAFAIEADVEATAIISNTFRVEWPPRSGRMAENGYPLH